MRELENLRRAVERLHRATKAAEAAGLLSEEIQRFLAQVADEIDGVSQGVAGAVSGSVAEPVVAQKPPVHTLPNGGNSPLTSGFASVRHSRTRTELATVWVQLGDQDSWGLSLGGTRWQWQGRGLAELLSHLPEPVELVYVTGPRPGGDAAGVRGWVMSQPPEGWAEAGHWLGDADHPVGRWTRPNGKRVEVHRAATWFGEGDFGPTEARGAHKLLKALLGATWGGYYLGSTPAGTARPLWLATIGQRQQWPVLSDDLRQLLASTSGQGRIEVLSADDPRDELAEFCYVDGRMMYGALTWGLPVGQPEWVHGWAGMADTERRRVLNRRGWLRVQSQVPEGWAHVGLLPVQGQGRGWAWPAAPGVQIDTWASTDEVRLAVANGWPVEVIEGMSWAEGKPLNEWTRRLLEVWQQAGQADDRAAGALVQRGVRAVLLYGVGVFASRGNLQTRHVPKDQAHLVPTGAEVTVSGKHLIWHERAPLDQWTAQTAHPEWAVTIWGRARTRLLDGPAPGKVGRVGALHLPRASLLGMRTDALYLDHLPGWVDDHRVGTFRVKGYLTGPVATPRTANDLLALRDKAEGAS